MLSYFCKFKDAVSISVYLRVYLSLYVSFFSGIFSYSLQQFLKKNINRLKALYY